MRNLRGLVILTGILLLLDLYIFSVIKYLSFNLTPRSKWIIYSIFWAITILSVVIIFLLPQLYFNQQYKSFITYAFAIVIGLFFLKLIIAFFFLLDDIRRVFSWIIHQLFNSSRSGSFDNSRSAFISWLGIAVGGSVFSSLLFGFNNKYNYTVKNISLRFPNLPVAFKGLRIVQLSDIHSGSFNNTGAVARGVQKVLALKPDLILFTGDLVNNLASEMHDYKELFAGLHAPHGIYSILGNHDYGDYYDWEDRDAAHRSLEEKSGKRIPTSLQIRNLEALKNLQAEMGWNLLINENVIIEKDNHQIAILGVENWSARSSFPKYGKLQDAYSGLEEIPFKILMSHDPSHWDAEVLQKFKDIDLTLSGHTHGMQFGVEIPGFKWSPIQYFYRQWAGIYEQNNQKLYINRGFGFLGYPGRVGIMPEITLIELDC
jgi:predicted MPP superfamily phosphohydrolase